MRPDLRCGSIRGVLRLEWAWRSNSNKRVTSVNRAVHAGQADTFFGVWSHGNSVLHQTSCRLPSFVRLTGALRAPSGDLQWTFLFFSEPARHVQTSFLLTRHALYAGQTPQPLCFVHFPDLHAWPGARCAGNDSGAVGNEWLRP